MRIDAWHFSRSSLNAFRRCPPCNRWPSPIGCPCAADGGGGIDLESPGREVRGEADFQAVNPGYFETLGIPLRKGRLLTASDRTGSTPVAVVNTAFVRLFVPNEDAVGR